MNKYIAYSPHASLSMMGLKLRQWHIWDIVEEHVRIAQKTVVYTPLEKLRFAMVNILAGGQGLVEINTRVRTDKMIVAAFGSARCAEQSTVSETINACTDETVEQMQEAIRVIYQKKSQGSQHDYGQQGLLLDVDMTGMPAGRQGEGVTKGYFSNQKSRRGRQLGRVTATQYDEIVVDQLFPGKRQLDKSLPGLVSAAEVVLALDDQRRPRTILRVDGGGGTDEDINWMLQHGYRILVKVRNWRRAAQLCQSVETWYPDPKIPEREVGFITQPHEYACPTRQIGIRTRKKDDTWSFHVLVLNLADDSLFPIARQPVRNQPTDRHVLLAAVYAYDLRSGGVETINRNAKQGLGLTRRNKKRWAAQMMLVLLAQLAYNLIVWFRLELAAYSSDFDNLKTLRMVRDVLAIPGRFETDGQGSTFVILNKGHPKAISFAKAFSQGLIHNDFVFTFGDI
ncbi:MAG: transposase [Anaerolineae bacterium]|nr:transposase [Anaerolineae bacterium]